MIEAVDHPDPSSDLLRLAMFLAEAHGCNNQRAIKLETAELVAACNGTPYAVVVSEAPAEDPAERLRVALSVIENLRAELAAARTSHNQERESWTRTHAASHSRIAQLESRIKDLQESYR